MTNAMKRKRFFAALHHAKRIRHDDKVLRREMLRVFLHVYALAWNDCRAHCLEMLTPADLQW